MGIITIKLLGYLSLAIGRPCFLWIGCYIVKITAVTPLENNFTFCEASENTRKVHLSWLYVEALRKQMAYILNSNFALEFELNIAISLLPVKQEGDTIWNSMKRFQH